MTEKHMYQKQGIKLNYYVYSVDCYGHGESLHDAKQYNIEDIGKAMICFMEDVVKEKVFLLGHSSGFGPKPHLAVFKG